MYLVMTNKYGNNLEIITVIIYQKNNLQEQNSRIKIVCFPCSVLSVMFINLFIYHYLFIHLRCNLVIHDSCNTVIHLRLVFTSA